MKHGHFIESHVLVRHLQDTASLAQRYRTCMNRVRFRKTKKKIVQAMSALKNILRLHLHDKHRSTCTIDTFFSKITCSPDTSFSKIHITVPSKLFQNQWEPYVKLFSCIHASQSTVLLSQSLSSQPPLYKTNLIFGVILSFLSLCSSIAPLIP